MSENGSDPNCSARDADTHLINLSGWQRNQSSSGIAKALAGALNPMGHDLFCKTSFFFSTVGRLPLQCVGKYGARRGQSRYGASG
jgi:hypothetical protein